MPALKEASCEEMREFLHCSLFDSLRSLRASGRNDILVGVAFWVEKRRNGTREIEQAKDGTFLPITTCGAFIGYYSLIAALIHAGDAVVPAQAFIIQQGPQNSQAEGSK